MVNLYKFDNLRQEMLIGQIRRICVNLRLRLSEIGVRQVVIVCRGCVPRSCSRVLCLSGRVVGLRVEGKEVTKCYMRVTAPFPTQTDTAQNEDIISLFFSAMQRGRRHIPSIFCTEKKDKWDKRWPLCPLLFFFIVPR